MTQTDEELVAAANRGEAEAFAALYRRHRAWVWTLARRFAPTAEDAADVMQDAFLHLWNRFPGFVLSARMRTFLYPVVRHLALDHRRRTARGGAEPEVGPEELEDLSLAPPGDVREELASALRGLSPAPREVILMRYVDELELVEIADALHVPLGTVKSRLHHALARLREQPGLRGWLEGE